MVPIERDFHKDDACQLSMLYLYASEDMSEVKVFVTDKRSDGRISFNVPRFRERRGTIIVNTLIIMISLSPFSAPIEEHCI